MLAAASGELEAVKKMISILEVAKNEAIEKCDKVSAALELFNVTSQVC
jgi:hypothetical protein